MGGSKKKKNKSISKNCNNSSIKNSKSRNESGCESDSTANTIDSEMSVKSIDVIQETPLFSQVENNDANNNYNDYSLTNPSHSRLATSSCAQSEESSLLGSLISPQNETLYCIGSLTRSNLSSYNGSFPPLPSPSPGPSTSIPPSTLYSCLLYTSDAADE